MLIEVRLATTLTNQFLLFLYCQKYFGESRFPSFAFESFLINCEATNIQKIDIFQQHIPICSENMCHNVFILSNLDLF